MAGDSQIELRVSRLENDRDSLYEIISDIRSTQQEHSLRLDGIDGRLDGIDGRLDGIDGRLDGIQTTLTEVVRRLPSPS